MCGDPDAAALIWAEESTPSELHSMSLQELRQNCMQTAAALNAWGAKPGLRRNTIPNVAEQIEHHAFLVFSMHKEVW